MRGNIAAFVLAASLGLASQSACAVNSPQPQASVDCRVTNADKLPAEVGGADFVCEAIRQAAAAKAPGVRYSIDVQVVSPSMLSARVTLPDGRVLPDQRHATMDRNVSRSSVQRFADAIAAELARAASR